MIEFVVRSNRFEPRMKKPLLPGTISGPPDQYVRPQLTKSTNKQIISGILKLAFTGPSSSGKTRAWRLMSNHADCASSPMPTRAIEWADLIGIADSGDCVALQLYDLSGQEAYYALAPQYYRTMHGYFAMFDMPAEARLLRQDMYKHSADEDLSYRLAAIHANRLVERMLKNSMTVERSAQAFPFKGLERPLVACMGNKSDLSVDMQCENLLRQALLAHLDGKNCKYFDTSALTGQGVGQAFAWMVETAIGHIAEHIRTRGYPPYTRPGCIDASLPSAVVEAHARSVALGSIFYETGNSDRERRMSPVSEFVDITAPDDRPEVFTCAC